VIEPFVKVLEEDPNLFTSDGEVVVQEFSNIDWDTFKQLLS
jgi:hypothetical protein